MSATKLVKLIFSMGYEDLIDECIEKEKFLTRDLADLASRNITAADVAALTAERVAFSAIPSNEAETEATSLGTAAVNKQAAILFTSIQLVMGIVVDTFSVKSPQYLAFNAKGLYEFTPQQLCNIAANVVTKGNANLVALKAKGLTAPMLTDITTQQGLLAPLISATPILKGDKNAVTYTRRTAANSLFSTLRELVDTANAYYKAAKNKLKEADYVIYGDSRAVVDRTGIVGQLSAKTRKAAGIIGTTRFRLKVKSGTGLQFYFGMTANSLPGPLFANVDFNPNNFTTKTATSLG